MPANVKPKHVLMTCGALLGALLLFWFCGGICYGREERRTNSVGTISGKLSSGSVLGPKQFYLRKGQTFVVSYRATVHEGHLHIRLLRPFGSAGFPARDVGATGSGEYVVVVPESGFYKVLIQCLGRHDVEFTAEWFTR